MKWCHCVSLAACPAHSPGKGKRGAIQLQSAHASLVKEQSNFYPSLIKEELEQRARKWQSQEELVSELGAKSPSSAPLGVPHTHQDDIIYQVYSLC